MRDLVSGLLLPLDPRVRGWWIAAGAALGLMVGYSATVATVFGQIAAPIGMDLDLTRSQVAGAIGFAIFPVIVVSPLVGLLVERFGAAKVIAWSQVLLFLAMSSLAFASSLEQLRLAFIAVAAAGAGTLPIAYTQIVLTWFDRRRGVALGIALSGVGLAAIVLAPATEFLIRTQGWRQGTISIAAIMGAIGIGNVLILMRQTPRAPNQMDGGTPAPERGPAFAAVDMISSDAMRTRSFWALTVGFLLLGIPTIGTVINLPAVLRDLGHDTEGAARLVAIFGAGTAGARLVAGWLFDRFPPTFVVAGIFAAPLIGFAGLAVGAGEWASLWVLCLAIGFGGEFDVMAYLLSRRFGHRAYARLYGVTYAGYTLGACVGPLFLAATFDHSGSYAPGLWVFALIVALAGASLMVVSRAVEGAKGPASNVRGAPAGPKPC